jgi:hypothetical protein
VSTPPRTFTLAVDDHRIVFPLKTTRWILERLRDVADEVDPTPSPTAALVVLLEEELENRHPRPITIAGAEAETLDALASVWAEFFSAEPDLVALHEALAEHIRRYGPFSR